MLTAISRDFGYDLYDPMPDRPVEEKERKDGEANGGDGDISPPDSSRGAMMLEQKVAEKEEEIEPR